MSIVVRCSESVEATRIASVSKTSLTCALADEAELWIARLPEGADAIVHGAFQRADAPFLQRGSGGPAVRVGSGTVHVVLALATASSLVACDPPRLVNRYVRPLLRALTRVGAMAHYFDRDWISVKHRPAAWVGFAHDATTKRCALEAFVALRTPFAIEARAAYLGKAPGTVEEIAGAPVDAGRFVHEVIRAYAETYARVAIDAGEYPEAAGGYEEAEPAWRGVVEEAIGPVCAGVDRAGVMRVGGEWLVSVDAQRRLEAALPAIAVMPREGREAAVARAVDDALATPGVALVGVRSLTSVRDAIVAALA